MNRKYMYPIRDAADIYHIYSGMGEVAKVVKSTYGPNGRNVIIEDDEGNPHITKDGVTVANSISFNYSLYDLGASLIKDAAMKTLKEVGDGTTTTVILSEFIAGKGLVHQDKVNPFKLRYYLYHYLDKVQELLLKESTPVDKTDRETLMEVALNSANGDEKLATTVVDVYSEVGKNGTIFVRDSDILGIHSKVIEGISINRGYSSPLFCMSGESSITMEDCLVLISKKVIRDYHDLVPYLSRAVETAKPILLVVPEVDNTVVELFLSNTLRGIFGGCVIQAPYSNERQQDFLNDLGILTGAISKKEDFGNTFLIGHADTVVVGRDDTEFRGFHPDENIYKEHLAFLTSLHDSQTDAFIAEKIAERLSVFSGSIGYIYAGASSEAESLELKDKIDDVVHAVKAALEEGVVLAGGLALDKVADLIEEDPIPSEEANTIAFNIIRDACKLPKRLLGDLEVTSKDPTKVVYTALKNAISVAGMLFTSKYTVIKSGEYEREGSQE